MHLITWFAQLIPGKCFCMTVLFAQPTCLPGERKKDEDSTKISTKPFAFPTLPYRDVGREKVEGEKMTKE